MSSSEGESVMGQGKTDWDAYYRKSSGIVSFTRGITLRRLRRMMAPKLTKQELRICELGGGNSCFLDTFLRIDNLNRYHVIDSNDYSIRLLQDRFSSDARVTYETRDILRQRESPELFDIVYSVGLIEHFSELDTRECVREHFKLLAPDGLVVITFPTPTVLYRVIRGIAEYFGVWIFHDERPLQFSEVEAGIREASGTTTHQSINWFIGLTQGCVVAELNQTS